jgi:hypothetical protein
LHIGTIAPGVSVDGHEPKRRHQEDLAMKYTTCVAFLVAWGAVRVAVADCGSIPFKPWVSVFEPNQRALIAFNGREQILILSTDLRASEPTKVLEVLPLPSEPKLKECDIKVFQSATDLINRKLPPRYYDGTSGMGGGGMGGGGARRIRLPPAGKVTLEERIGAHDISVTQVLDGRRFVEWADDYLRRQGVAKPKIPAPLKPVIGEYIHDGFRWFAFDVVDLGKETVTKDAIQYRFRTNSLYYPLRITRAETGETNVNLLVLTPGLVRMPSGKDLDVRLVHPPIEITHGELRELDEDLNDLLRYGANLRLRTWHVSGKLSEFRRDIVTR